MASLTGLAFQIDFLVGRGSRRNAVSAVRDTVDNINIVARAGAKKAAEERKKSLEEQLGKLDALARKSSEKLVKGKEETAAAIAKRGGRTAAAATRRIKADTSALDAVGKKTVSVAKQMKSAFKGLNATIAAETKTGKLAGTGFTSEKTAVDFAKRQKDERQQIVDLIREANDAKRVAGKLTEGDIHNLRMAENLHRQITDLERQAAEDGRDIEKEKKRLIHEFNEEQKELEKNLRDEIYLRQQQGQAIENVARSVKDTLRNSFVYATAAVAAFYYKLNAVNQEFMAFEKELINAQSIFQTTNETLFSLSDQIAHFGLTYGIELQNASTGLYQLASAGLSAEDSIAVLNDTLMLSMAVQGDHNTIAKLTTQTIFGFGLEMSDSSILVDKFAHAINKSLIEYQDLAAAVKFAMPFFVATGQSVDQLLGSIQVLTNRALEAGIAGRGLRQALSEFAEGAEDSTRTFAQLGVKVIDAQGNFLQLTEIARNFKNVFGEAATDVELMTTLLEDLNVRGATAFVHLVQNVDEFESAVNDLQNSAGSAAKMAEIQQKSLTNQIQILKNALMAPFLITDAIGTQHGYMNEFQMVLHQVIGEFGDLIYVVGPDGEAVLTDIGRGMKNFVIAAMRELASLLKEGMQLFKAYAKSAGGTEQVLSMLTVPLRLLLDILTMIGPQGIQFILMWKVLNGLLPITSMLTWALADAKIGNGIASLFEADGNFIVAASLGTVQLATLGVYGALGLLVALNLIMIKSNPILAASISIVTGAILALAVATMVLGEAKKQALYGGNPYKVLAVAALGAMIGLGVMLLMRKMMKTPEVPTYDVEQYNIGAPTMDTGGRVPMTYDTGGRPGHKMVMVEPGETIISKSQNMLGGSEAYGGGGINIVIEGDVYDADNFAAKLSEVLPQALNRATDDSSLAVRTTTFGSTFGKTAINRGTSIMER